MQAGARRAWIAGWLAWWVAVAGVQAQGTPGAMAPTSAPGTNEQEQRPGVLFLLPQTDADTEARLREAVLAQFALVEVRVEFESVGSLDPSAADRMEAMRARAASHGAMAAFSLDERGDGRWYMYLLDVERERLLARSFDAGPERRNAAIEAVALVARESTRALLEGAPMPEVSEPPAPEREEEPTPPAAQPAHPEGAPEHKSGVPPLRRPPGGGLRLWVGYAGVDFADKVPPRHMVALGAGWLGLAPWYGAVAAEFGPAIELAPPASPVAFQVLRVPLHANVGHRYRQDRVAFDLELGLTAELLHRTFDPNQPGAAGVQIEPLRTSDNDWLVAVGLRARVEYLFVSWAGVAAELGFDALTNANKFKYLARKDDADVDLLLPRPVRPIWSLAMAFYP